MFCEYMQTTYIELSIYLSIKAILSLSLNGAYLAVHLYIPTYLHAHVHCTCKSEMIVLVKGAQTISLIRTSKTAVVGGHLGL